MQVDVQTVEGCIEVQTVEGCIEVHDLDGRIITMTSCRKHVCCRDPSTRNTLLEIGLTFCLSDSSGAAVLSCGGRAPGKEARVPRERETREKDERGKEKDTDGKR